MSTHFLTDPRKVLPPVFKTSVVCLLVSYFLTFLLISCSRKLERLLYNEKIKGGWQEKQICTDSFQVCELPSWSVKYLNLTLGRTSSLRIFHSASSSSCASGSSKDVRFPWQPLVNLICLTLCEKWFPERNEPASDSNWNAPCSKDFCKLHYVKHFCFFPVFLCPSSSGISHLELPEH